MQKVWKGAAYLQSSDGKSRPRENFHTQFKMAHEMAAKETSVAVKKR